jgi:hypothetical protein
MRWLFATMMYVTRVISQSEIDKILSAVIPSAANVVDLDSMRNDIYRMVLELQSDICHTHECVARAWIEGPLGISFLTDQQRIR